ncbi:MAG: hypothetical protein PPP55_06810 [Halorubrum sp.]
MKTVGELCDLGIDAAPLEAFAAETRRHCEDLAERIDERESERPYDRVCM